MYTRGPNSPYTKYGGYKERPHKSGKRSYSDVKKSFKAQHGQIPIDPAILAAIRKKKIQNANAQVRDDARGNQKPETLSLA